MIMRVASADAASLRCRPGDDPQEVHVTGRFVRSLGITFTLLAACQQTPSGPGLNTAELPIVNGVIETGWPSVGALTAYYPPSWGGYAGAFCTATLIQPQWALTAGHCMFDEQGNTIVPSQTRFFLGNDARRSNTYNGPIDGTLYAIDAVYPHSGYNDSSLANDIALVHLSSPITSTASIATSTDYPQTGTTATYIGFGATEGISETGSGIKRSTTFPISYVYSNEGVYVSDYNGTGTCFGDSGGPGLQQKSGVWKVIGITSAGTGCAPGQTCDPDPCKRPTIHTRVDYYASWIAQITNTQAPSCTSNPSMCACSQACQSNGVCNNTICQTGSCEDTYDCLVGCADATCQTSCYDNASTTAQGQLDALFQCIDQYCGNVSDSQYGTCVNTNCASQISACFPVGSGAWTCRQVYDCLVDCPSTDDTCGGTCYEQGTTQAQSELDGLLNCLNDKCGTVSGDAFQTCASQQCGNEIDICLPTLTGDATCDEVASCIGACSDTATDCPYGCYETGTAVAQSQYIALVDCADTKCGTLSGNDYVNCYSQQCANELNACFPPANCAITGGGCGAGMACYPMLTGATDCYPSNGKGFGVACADTDTALDCADGLVCVDGVCEAFCGTSAHCGVGRTCQLPFDEATPNIGVCGCTDADNDGVCASEDCNDQDSNIRPGAAEGCDGKDNNCDGQTDEGCGGCIDNDRDGYCVEVDCNDDNSAMNPGAVELCGDNLDNNCNTETDEGCATCVDADRDGYCSQVDCNDNAQDIHPGVVEVCDGVDNDCNGATDEGCGSTDGDTIGGDATIGTDTGVIGHPQSDGCAGGAGGGQGLALVGLALLLLAALRRRVGGRA
ncbi:MAG: trypsin-like serine protease [Deltaproteobacteria bacterium]|nr:MAG: trypsin-like serine protease [Deltaproteobacteria bacterium]